MKLFDKSIPREYNSEADALYPSLGPPKLARGS